MDFNRAYSFVFRVQKKKGFIVAFLTAVLILSSTFLFNIQTCAAQSSVLFSDGFETGDFSNWSTGGHGSFSQAVSTQYPTQGTYCAQFTVNSQDGGSYAYKTDIPVGEQTSLSFSLQLSALPSTSGELMLGGYHGQSQDQSVSIILRSIGNSLYWGLNNGVYHFKSQSSILAAYTDYNITLVMDKQTSQCILYVNGIEQLSIPQTWTQTNYDIYVGILATFMTVGSGLNAYVDNVFVSTLKSAPTGTVYLNLQMDMTASIPSYTFYDISMSWSTISGNPIQQHAFQPVHTDSIIEVDKVIDGNTWKYLAYDSTPEGSQINLYYSNETAGTWTPYSGNPILGPQFDHYRWPSVTYANGDFNMFLEDYTGGTLEWWISNDGINFSFIENVISSSSDWYSNPFIWFNANDAKWYLYYHDSLGVTEFIKVRSASSLNELKTTSSTVVLSVNLPFGSPTMMFYEGKYWLLAEIEQNSVWQVVAYASATSASSGFVQANNSPILTDDRACPMIFLTPDETQAYLYTTDDQSTWVVNTREVYLNGVPPPAYEESNLTMPIQASWIANDGALYAGSNETLYKSLDQGVTWQPLLTFNSSNPVVLGLVYVNQAGTVFTSPSAFPSLDNELGIWRSTDGGATWTQVLLLGPNFDIHSMSEDSNGVLFAGVYTTGDGYENGNARIYRSTDDGATWNSVYYDPLARHIHNVAVDTSDNYIYASVGDLISPWNVEYIIRSTDGGDSWEQILAGMPQVVSIGIVPGARLFGTDAAINGEIFRTTDDSSFTGVFSTGGLSYGFWFRTDVLTGKVYASFISGEASPRNAGIFVSSDNGLTWVPFKTFKVYSSYLGSAFASNFYQGTMYYSVQLDASSGGWQNGIRLDNELPSPHSLEHQIVYTDQTEESTLSASLVNSSGLLFLNYSLLGFSLVTTWLSLKARLSRVSFSKLGSIRNHSYRFQGSNNNIKSIFWGGGKI